MGCRWGRERVECVENAAIRVREEVAVEVERDADRRHLRLEVLRVLALDLRPGFVLIYTKNLRR
jgi:hypothetical protein